MSIVNRHFPNGDPVGDPVNASVSAMPMPPLQIHDADGNQKSNSILLLEATHWTACGAGDNKYKFWEHPDRPMEQFTFDEALVIARSESRRACIAGENEGRVR